MLPSGPGAGDSYQKWHGKSIRLASPLLQAHLSYCRLPPSLSLRLPICLHFLAPGEKAWAHCFPWKTRSGLLLASFVCQSPEMDDPSTSRKCSWGSCRLRAGCLCAAGEGTMVRAVAACSSELSGRLLGVWWECRKRLFTTPQVAI